MPVIKKIRTAVVGTGYLGGFHAEKYSQLENSQLVAVVDLDGKRAGEVAAKVGTRAYTSYREILEMVDAVSIAVPTNLHYEVAKDFLEKGVGVLLEKPMTTTLSEADKLIRIAKEKGAVLQIGHL